MSEAQEVKAPEVKPEEVKPQEAKQPPSNEIRVGNRSKPKDLISQCEKLLKEDKLKEIHLTAVGNSIADLIIAVEILKSSNPGLFQENILSTIGPRSPKNSNNKEKEKENEKPQKLYPHLEIVLSCEKIELKEAPKMTEEERKILLDTLDKQKANFNKQRRFNSFRRRRNARNARFGYRRQRFASAVRRNPNNRFNRNGRNWSYNMNNKRRPRPGYNNRNNRRVFQNNQGGRRFNNNKASNPVNPASRNPSANKEPAKN